MRKGQLSLPALLCLFVILALLHNWATPIFEAPDEAQHYAYIRWIVRTHHLPALDDDASSAAQEVAQPPLYYLTAALLTAPLDDENLLDHLWHNPSFGYQGALTGAEDKNMLIHPPMEFHHWEDGLLVVHITRLVSTLFGIVAVVAAWGLGYELFGTLWGALTVAAMVALQPQFIFICSVISNDSAAAALGALGLWLMVTLVRRGPSPGRALALGAAIGAAAATKTSLLPMAALAAAVLLYAIRVGRLSGSRRLSVILAFLLPAILLGSPWYLRNLVHYGDPLGLTRHIETLWRYTEPLPWGQLIAQLPVLWRSFWGAYGWGHIAWPTWVYLWLLLLTLPLFCSGLCCKETLTEAGKLLSALWLGAITVLLLAWMRKVEAPHGRLLFPALSAWAALLTAGLRRMKRSFLWRLLLLGTMVLLATLAPAARLLATFMPPPLFDEERVTERFDDPHLTYGEKARLVGVRPPPLERRFHPGETVPLTLCWEAIRPMRRDYTLFIHLLGPDNGIVAARHTWPGNGRYPTSLWEPGWPFCDTYVLHLPLQVESPMRYLIEVGLFDAESGDRLEAYRPGGEVVAPPVIGGLIIVPKEPLPPPAHPITGTILGNKIALVGIDRPPSVATGAVLSVTLHWEALTAPDDELIAFVHLWREGDPRPLAQDDAPPRGGWFPTMLWQRGDRVPDLHQLHIPADLPPGRYPLWAGLYRAQDGQRLPAFREGEPLPYDLVPLGAILITSKE